VDRSDIYHLEKPKGLMTPGIMNGGNENPVAPDELDASLGMMDWGEDE
jgi:hypothetical protein